MSEVRIRWRRAGAAAALAAVLLGVGPGAARAQPAATAAEQAEAALAQVHEHLDGFEYAEAVARLSDLIARQPPPELELRARALVVRAEASRGDAAAARAAAEQLYRRDPGYRIPDDDSLSPRIRAHFADARQRIRAEPPRDVDVRVSAAEDRVRLRLSAPTPALVDRVLVGIRQGDTYREVEARPAEGGGYVTLVPRAPALRYYARFLAPSGYVVAEAGSPEVPRSWTDAGAVRAREPVDLRPAEEEGEDRTGLWVGLGVGAAVLIAAAIALSVWQPWNQGPSLEQGLELP
jgi:hypothetical protein